LLLGCCQLLWCRFGWRCCVSCCGYAHRSTLTATGRLASSSACCRYYVVLPASVLICDTLLVYLLHGHGCVCGVVYGSLWMPLFEEAALMVCEHQTHCAAAAASCRMHSTVLDPLGWQFCFCTPRISTGHVLAGNFSAIHICQLLSWLGGVDSSSVPLAALP
jgi:hypothetical protein